MNILTYDTQLNSSCFPDKTNPKLAKSFKTQTMDLKTTGIWMAHAVTKTVTGHATLQNA
jgi:hypothetical protein